MYASLSSIITFTESPVNPFAKIPKFSASTNPSGCSTVTGSLVNKSAEPSIRRAGLYTLKKSLSLYLEGILSSERPIVGNSSLAYLYIPECAIATSFTILFVIASSLVMYFNAVTSSTKGILSS